MMRNQSEQTVSFSQQKMWVLKQYFGYSAFRPGQEAIIDTILSGRDLCGILPTGGGKSLCYQIPALIFPGLSIIVSPLISLIEDQVASLRQKGIPAAGLTSLKSALEQKEILQKACQGSIKLLYLAPERLQTKTFQLAAQKMKISFLSVDEAHCISQWGRDFRPSYRHICDFITQLPVRPVVAAFTATASPEIRADIVNMLQMDRPRIVVTGFDRPNLYYEVRKTKKKWPLLLSLLKKYQGLAGIIYCRTRLTSERLTEKLNRSGRPALCYHAGLSSWQRQQNQAAWTCGKVPLIVATNAFGMGIDKPDVRFVIHYNMPQDLEAYYQEAGRAGRDGLPSDCILLVNDRDPILGRFFIEQSSDPAARKIQRQKLHQMQFYAGGSACLRKVLLNYFGQHAPDFCGSCSVCLQRGRYSKNPLPKGGESPDLYRTLVSVRKRLARDKGKHPDQILSDQILHDMAKSRPQTLLDLAMIEGVPLHKCKKYGADFLSEIRAYLDFHDN